MAIPTGVQGEATAAYINDIRATMPPTKKFTLSALSDTIGIIDPQTSEETTARAIRTDVAGTLALVDPHGNTTTEVVAAGELVLGLCNGVKSTGTVTITAPDLTVYI